MNELSLFNTLFNGALDDQMQDYGFGTHFDVPKVDVTQCKDAYRLEMDLPGRTENDINLELDNNVLTISSVNEETKETSDKENKKHDGEKTKWLIKERRASSFSRRFTLPDDVDSENVSASFKNGVLNVTIPRKALTAPKKIAITA